MDEEANLLPMEERLDVGVVEDIGGRGKHQVIHHHLLRDGTRSDDATEPTIESTHPQHRRTALDEAEARYL